MTHNPFIAPAANDRFAKRKFPNKVALIDADRYKYVVTYEMYKRTVVGKDVRSLELLHEIVDDYLFNDIFSSFECKAYIFCFSASSKNVFRNAITQEKKYKGNRENRADQYDYPGKAEDMGYVYKYMHTHFPTLLFPDLEADDLLSMLQHPERTFIFSHDKDLKQVVGFHYNMNEHYLEYTTEEEGMQMLINQMLTGDTVDNIPGMPGFGPKALEKFHADSGKKGNFETLVMCMKQYVDKFGVLHGADMFAEMWQLLSMRLNRGAYCRQKYEPAFLLIESLVGEEALKAEREESLKEA